MGESSGLSVYSGFRGRLSIERPQNAKFYIKCIGESSGLSLNSGLTKKGLKMLNFTLNAWVKVQDYH